ncbi:CDP-diacylglycerol--serine O-phosphatidyltransferase [Caldimonas thermodepolymerans]|jgi:CDP-diacylglycerol--serine O-phosphatidyltransferase|uniref:CDP-diacylglycerol--serine O-phosphatidyltransferase n=1 Tax=Caldimonas thermodepolymerans TaxID=215580 RepID=A0A2S5T6C2_9BURK|nr:phosphatidylcholine/phosphatidylserine synthase [Caldimonas thermodepolymerans]PPE70417.1 CDP-diacylglycerol--serine O-phosphatidyltransferase [Caldimonas thermodepolymerans]QPC30324.1 CDP-diacylglycerol--serine O-phosphatidyltransferase [Caldimonas thermodepolymerans]RDI00724.1 CDP-diacylglycerol--serine O-phosphatidyltransferase [Caldimonas thermodepolymerans]TCP06997.1 CDP-diacylglycerol--serine O-phosphatidyltransferase [Caldimonas thermodepolymerans]UZG43087.1 CDP-diacylglycerol--serin
MTEPQDPAGTAVPDLSARPRRKGIYILPNLFTLAALFAGFYAVVMAMNGRFDLAAVGIFSAAVLDSLDGRVARMTNTQSTFGEQMDSLSDMVSFGAAPALIVYEWALQGLGKLGWLAAFIYCAGAALRLARFNTNIGIVDKRFFQGLPSPAAAAMVIGLVWVMDDFGYKGVEHIPWLAWTAFGFTVYAGLTMVTNVPFYSFKDISFRRSVPFIVIVAIALAFAVVAYDPPRVLFGLFVLYGLSGYVVYLVKKSRGKPVSVIAVSTDEPDEQGLHQ